MTRWVWPALALVLAVLLAASTWENVSTMQMLGRAEAAMSNLEGADDNLKRESAKLAEVDRRLEASAKGLLAANDWLRSHCR